MTDAELLDKLESIWRAGEEEPGVAEDGTEMFRRLAVLVAIRSKGGRYPDIRTLIRDMPHPAQSRTALIQ